MTRLKPGQSGYFSKPAHVLDPHLFDGDHLKPDVRQTLNNLLLDYLNSRYNAADSWIMAWLAGSGISYQWYSDRGNGDLDILLGIDYDKFLQANPSFEYMDRAEIVLAIDTDLKNNLWPQTAYTEFDYQYYEVTFFLSDNVGYDPDSITNIRPYAAYNITKDEWTTKPPVLPENPISLYPAEYSQAADANRDTASTLYGRYKSLNSSIFNGPEEVNRQAHLNLIKSQARSLFDSIHLGRKNAFSSQGEGYGDYYNYAWQRAKQDGLVTALKEIIGE